MIFHNGAVAQTLVGDCLATLQTLPAGCANTCITSPPYYGLRDYGHEGQIGLEETPEAYIARLVEVFREVRRVLKDDGTLWLNIGDSYASFKDAKCVPNSLGGNQRSMPATGAANRSSKTFANSDIKNKDLIGIPWMLAFALRADGWYLRQDIIWHKPNPMPESVTDRCTKAHEYVFLLSKSAKYFYDNDAVKEAAVCDRLPGRGMTDTKATYGLQNGGNGGLKALRNKLNDQGATNPTRNRRSVWTVTTKPYAGAHFAVFPPELIEPCVLAGSIGGGVSY